MANSAILIRIQKVKKRMLVYSSDIDPHFFRDPSLSISDRSQIGQTGTKHSLLCVTVLQYSHRWRELIYSGS